MALYDTQKNLIAGSRKTNIYRCNSFAEYEALPAAEKAKYDYVATPDSTDVVDLTSTITQESGHTSGYVTVEKCGHIVALYFHSLVVNAYDATVLSGFPKPTANNFYIVVQGDGNPQTIGIAFMDGYGNLKSGSATGGLVPGVVWDGVATYFTND